MAVSTITASRASAGH
ncbi:hypothetical protein YPPY96_2137, partial [Yersinia pestis PY-96]